MYKLKINMFGETIVEKIDKNIFFKLPTKPDSSDAREYLAWVSEGNTPEEAD
jgi:hypothetical protein